MKFRKFLPFLMAILILGTALCGCDVRDGRVGDKDTPAATDGNDEGLPDVDIDMGDDGEMGDNDNGKDKGKDKKGGNDKSSSEKSGNGDENSVPTAVPDTAVTDKPDTTP